MPAAPELHRVDAADRASRLARPGRAAPITWPVGWASLVARRKEVEGELRALARPGKVEAAGAAPWVEPGAVA